MTEQTFVMIKPEHVGLAEIIFDELSDPTITIEANFVESVPRTIIEQHYAEHEGKAHHPRLMKQFTGQTVVVAKCTGENVIQYMINHCGATDPSEADPATIRGKYSKDSFRKAGKRDEAVQNVIHRSADAESAAYELKVWQEYLP